MGDSSGSMLYAVAGFLILYFAGVIIYKVYDIIKKTIGRSSKKQRKS